MPCSVHSSLSTRHDDVDSQLLITDKIQIAIDLLSSRRMSCEDAGGREANNDISMFMVPQEVVVVVVVVVVCGSGSIQISIVGVVTSCVDVICMWNDGQKAKLCPARKIQNGAKERC